MVLNNYLHAIELLFHFFHLVFKCGYLYVFGIYVPELSICFDIHYSNISFQLFNLCSFLLKVYLMTFFDHFEPLIALGFRFFPG